MVFEEFLLLRYRIYIIKKRLKECAPPNKKKIPGRKINPLHNIIHPCLGKL